ncbi:MAG: ABC transporter permease [Eubacteriales bacterium]|nr:ABC transporter permease [Eubacteriales bacterium]
MTKRQWIPGVIGILIVGIIVGASILAPWIAPYGPNDINMAESLVGPCKEHLLGTDLLGRDLFSRILYGGRSSMVLALLATILSMLFGILVGTTSGYFGGIFDDILTIVTNIFQGLPGTSLMVAIAGILGPSFKSLMLALVLTNWTGFSRIVRTEVLKYREENFVEGLKSLGESDWKIIWKHIVPNMLGNVMVLFTTRIGRSLLSIAGLSYLGLGIQPPNPDWSVMLSDAQMSFRSNPHLILAPGICLVLLIFGINLIGDMLRDWLDKQNREAGGYL